MCYAIPGKVVAIDGSKAIIDYFGEERKILLDLDDVKVGDYLFAQGGISVRKIPAKEAQEILQTWQKVFFELKKTDAALAKIDSDKLPPNILNILHKVDIQKSLNKEEMAALFNLQDTNELKVLFEVANNIRQRVHGNASCVHGILEFSNYCQGKCHYCGIRRDHEIPRYRMNVADILAAAKEAIDIHGFKALVLQSGEDYWYDEAKLVEIVTELRRMGVLIFLSIGFRDKELYRKLYAAGARAALMRFETSNEDLFTKLRPGTKLADRIGLIKYLRSLGYILATGFIIGFPGETTEDLINNILLTKYLAPDMYSFGPLLPTKGTPLESAAQVSKDLVLKTTAISRLVDSNANILVTTALETLDQNAKKEALLAGANSMMINVTPDKYKPLYSIYDNRAGADENLASSIQQAVDLLYSLGRAPTDLGLKTLTFSTE